MPSSQGGRPVPEPIASPDTALRPGQAIQAPPHLGHDDLVQAQQDTLMTPRRRYGLLARLLFVSLDVVYGRKRTLSKFRVLELIARVPYQAWEQVAYIAVTHVHRRGDLARRVHDRVLEARQQQDNEQWHLLVLTELISEGADRESGLKFYWLPQLIAVAYYHVSWLLYVIEPGWSYRLNADFEDHAEHEYMIMVGEHPEWESAPFAFATCAEYGQFDSVADVMRQIGHDERVHKLDSLAHMNEARFR
jgi:ubiquinol oxidase